MRLAGRVFKAWRMAPTVSRSSLAGGAAESDGFASVSLGADASGVELGRSSGAASALGAAGLSTGVANAGFAAEMGAVTSGLSFVARLSSSVRFNALSIADIAAETGSGAEFCFAIVSASFYRRRSLEDRPTRQQFSRAWPRPGKRTH